MTIYQLRKRAKERGLLIHRVYRDAAENSYLIVDAETGEVVHPERMTFAQVEWWLASEEAQAAARAEHLKQKATEQRYNYETR